MRHLRYLSILLLAAGLRLAATTAVGADAPPVLPPGMMALSDVKPGMKGEWRTVVQGSTVQTFQLEVLGVMENFNAPKLSIIICQATDPSQIENGPVQGMSGSPVYIDGKLVGAYAYGFTQSKDQAIIGVTPIQEMLEVFDAPASLPLPGRPAPMRVTASSDKDNASLAEDNLPPRGMVPTMSGLGGWHITQGAERLGGQDLAAAMKPLPTPLFASGISTHTLAALRGEYEKRGLQVMQVPGGSSTTGGPTAASLEPGSAIGVSLLTGDFAISGVGTLTWRDGDRLLAFGHPMFGFGPVDLPMTTAEVITVVRSLDSSFKLANTGPVVGTISQDRLTGISGKLGEIPPMTSFHTRVTGADGKVRNFQGQLWQNREMTPLLGATGLLESLSSSILSEQQQTFFVSATLDIEGFPPVKINQVASGQGGATDVALGFLRQYTQLLDNPFATPHVRAVDFEVRLSDKWLLSTLEEVRVENGPVRAGDILHVTLVFANYLNISTQHTLEVPIPASAAGETLSLFLGDATAADALDRGTTRGDFTSLADIVSYLRQEHSRGALYVKLLRNAPGLRLDGASLPGLPPSVEALYKSPRNITTAGTMDRTTVWETSVPVDGEYSGRYTLPITVRP